MDSTNQDLARRALYLARFANADTFVGISARRLMRSIGAELDARGFDAVSLLTLFHSVRP